MNGVLRDRPRKEAWSIVEFKAYGSPVKHCFRVLDRELAIDELGISQNGALWVFLRVYTRVGCREAMDEEVVVNVELEAESNRVGDAETWV